MVGVLDCNIAISEFELQSCYYIHFRTNTVEYKLFYSPWYGLNNTTFNLAQSAGATEYTDCISAKGQDSPNECPGYEAKQSDGEVLVMLELWGMRSTLLLQSLLGPLWSAVVAPDEILSMGQVELNCRLMLN